MYTYLVRLERNWQVRRDVDLMRSKHGMVPGLAVIMVGERRDSAKYVSMKQVSIALSLYM